MTKDKILVIEDNRLNLKLVKELLRLGKFEVLEASDAESGIDLAKAHNPALILMDVQLPGINGLEATALLKKNDNLSNIPIVALTGCAMKGDRQMALDAGCAGYISKPINTRIFLEQIAQFLNDNNR